MRVFILSLLAVSSVHSHAIRYPYHGQLLSYQPARGEFPVYNEHQQGYVRYIDSNGLERFVGYNYPEPLYGVRRISYGSQSAGNQQLLKTYGGAPEAGFSAESYYQIQDSSEVAKAREEHFRRWCEQRYQALKAELDKMRAEGLKPPSDMLAQLQPLEKIISSTTYTAIAGDTPELQRIRDEHLRIWNEARLKVLQQEADHLRFSMGGAKPADDVALKTTNLESNIGETAAQKLAHEEHLRIHNEQLAALKHLEAEQQRLVGEQQYNKPTKEYLPAKFEIKTGYQQLTQQQPTNVPIAETPEVIKAREEHLRIYNEQLAKLKQLESEKTRYHIADSAETTKISDTNTNIGETAEQQKAREEHLRLYNEQLAKVKELEAAQKLQQGEQTYGYQQQQVKQVPDLALKSSFQPQMGPIADTPEVIKAREVHLRIYNEQLAKLKQLEAEKTRYNYAAGEFIGETAEQKRVREEHLRIYNEQLAKVKQMEVEKKLKQGIWSTQGYEAQDFALKASFEGGATTTTTIGDTPEVIRAREEHLRLVNEAKLRAQAEGSYNSNDDGSYKAEYQAGSSYKAEVEATPILKFVPTIQQPVQPIQNIAIVQAAQPINQGIQQQQQAESFLKTSTATINNEQPTPVQDTPEVIRAREEHLRLVEAAKLKATQDKKPFEATPVEAHVFTINEKTRADDASGVRLMTAEDMRLMEAERLRDAERMREEERMREMERLREIERQKEEEKMLESERLRLKQEEAQRMEMERLAEEQRLREEQTKRISTTQVSSSTAELAGSQLKSQPSIATTQIVGAIAGPAAATTTTGGSGFVLSSEYQNNPYLIRFASQAGNTAYIIGDKQELGLKTVAAKPNLYYLPSAQNEAPAYLRYTISGSKAPIAPIVPIALQQTGTTTLTGGAAEKISTYSASSSSSSSSSSSTDSSSSSNLKLSYGSSSSTDTTSTGLTELEKTTREHFRAHELALEQLRLANLKTPYNKDCN